MEMHLVKVETRGDWVEIFLAINIGIHCNQDETKLETPLVQIKLTFLFQPFMSVRFR